MVIKHAWRGSLVFGILCQKGGVPIVMAFYEPEVMISGYDNIAGALSLCLYVSFDRGEKALCGQEFALAARVTQVACGDDEIRLSVFYKVLKQGSRRDRILCTAKVQVRDMCYHRRSHGLNPLGFS